MWYKLDELEEKYGLNKLSVYKLITQEPELRQYFKSMEGVLQINEQGVGILLKHTSKEAEDKSPATFADNNTVIIKREHINESVSEENAVKEESAPAKDDEIDLFADAFQPRGSFFDEAEEEEDAASLEPEENFFANIDADYKEEEEDYNVELEKDFSEGLIFQDEIKVEDDLTEADEVNANVYDDTGHDDFFSDEPIDHSKFLDSVKNEVTEITAASEDDYTREGYVKALKEKMIIQNEQIRALSNYLEISKKLLIQDEKIVNIIEGIYKK